MAIAWHICLIVILSSCFVTEDFVGGLVVVRSGRGPLRPCSAAFSRYVPFSRMEGMSFCRSPVHRGAATLSQSTGRGGTFALVTTYRISWRCPAAAASYVLCGEHATAVLYAPYHWPFRPAAAMFELLAPAKIERYSLRQQLGSGERFLRRLLV